MIVSSILCSTFVPWSHFPCGLAVWPLASVVRPGKKLKVIQITRWGSASCDATHTFVQRIHKPSSERCSNCRLAKNEMQWDCLWQCWRYKTPTRAFKANGKVQTEISNLPLIPCISRTPLSYISLYPIDPELLMIGFCNTLFFATYTVLDVSSLVIAWDAGTCYKTNVLVCQHVQDMSCVFRAS